MSIFAANFSEKGELIGEKGLFTCPLVNLLTT